MVVEVSIITAAYNCKNTILETYNSIKNQTFSNWEWIVVEDCSADGSFEYIQEITKNDKRVTVLKNEKNSGAAVSRNRGIEIAKGRYIAFLDADDSWRQEKLEHQLTFMKENNYPFTYTDYEVRFWNGVVKPYIPKRNYATYKLLLRSCDIGTLTVIYDSSVLGKVYMPTDCDKREDHCTWLDMTRNGLVAHKLDEVLAMYRVSEGSLSGDKWKLIKYQYLVYRKHEKFNFFKSVWYLLLRANNKIFRKY